MVHVDKYELPPTRLIPNSPYPLLHYRGFMQPGGTRSIASRFYDVLEQNGWEMQWIFQYGSTQQSHYHSAAHECMVVLTGQATIRFGAADTVEDLQESTYGKGREDGGVEVAAQAGDVFIIPAGVAHKTFDTVPEAPFKLLTQGDGHGVPSDIKEKLDDISLAGFTMMGAYPVDGGAWDFAVGGEGPDAFARVWAVPPAKLDPVLGDSPEGICGLWVGNARAMSVN